jgi:uncharacterized protein (TIGR02147 family)
MEHSTFQFEDYLDYLKVISAGTLAKQKKKWTLKEFARRLGYQSPRSIGMVLAGERLPSTEMINRISIICSHSPMERRYFELLIQLEKYKRKHKDPYLVLEQIRELNPKIDNIVMFDAETFRFIAEWYHLVIKQLIDTPNFREDAGWIRKRLYNKVTTAEIRQAIATMLKLGILERSEQGRLATTGKFISTQSDVVNLASRHHHSQMIDRAKESLNNQDIHMREFDSRTMRFDRKNIPAAKKMIHDFRNQFIQRFCETESDDIFQLNLQFFSQTESIQEKDKLC